MLDREGYRPNVGIILVNHKNEVFWGKRIREKSWQFPQGGIKYGESPAQAMFRELHEELGLKPEHVQILGRTREWLRYNVPEHFVRRESRGHYKGQKQIWFLLRLVGKDKDLSLRSTMHPEFDAWRWSTYWVPLEQVIEFKRGVYTQALRELSALLKQPKAETRFLRQRKNKRRGQESSAEGEVLLDSVENQARTVQTKPKSATHRSKQIKFTHQEVRVGDMIQVETKVVIEQEYRHKSEEQ